MEVEKRNRKKERQRSTLRETGSVRQCVSERVSVSVCE